MFEKSKESWSERCWRERRLIEDVCLHFSRFSLRTHIWNQHKKLLRGRVLYLKVSWKQPPCQSFRVPPSDLTDGSWIQLGIRLRLAYWQHPSPWASWRVWRTMHWQESHKQYQKNEFSIFETVSQKHYMIVWLIYAHAAFQYNNLYALTKIPFASCNRLSTWIPLSEVFLFPCSLEWWHGPDWW